MAAIAANQALTVIPVGDTADKLRHVDKSGVPARRDQS